MISHLLIQYIVGGMMESMELGRESLSIMPLARSAYDQHQSEGVEAILVWKQLLAVGKSRPLFKLPPLATFVTSLWLFVSFGLLRGLTGTTAHDLDTGTLARSKDILKVLYFVFVTDIVVVVSDPVDGRLIAGDR
mmetsp:Transcript_42701/g.112382  ORF Transcript_42701/g.112382 Transcript_42701/m.112382 type:complete len:135 (-) Transcript_42701:2369-2773(-)